jgi:ATP-dependent Clp protease ATP-binding subunit ClpC
VDERTIRTPRVASRDPLVLLPGGTSTRWPPPERFAPDAEQALLLAQDVAARQGHNHLGPVHVLVGIAEEMAGRGGKILRDLGVTKERAEAALVKVAGRGDTGYDAEEITLIPRAQRVLDFAQLNAQRRGGNTTDTEDLLRAIIDEREHLATELLRELGLSGETVRAKR